MSQKARKLILAAEKLLLKQVAKPILEYGMMGYAMTTASGEAGRKVCSSDQSIISGVHGSATKFEVPTARNELALESSDEMTARVLQVIRALPRSVGRRFRAPMISEFGLLAQVGPV